MDLDSKYLWKNPSIPHLYFLEISIKSLFWIRNFYFRSLKKKDNFQFQTKLTKNKCQYYRDLLCNHRINFCLPVFLELDTIKYLRWFYRNHQFCNCQSLRFLIKVYLFLQEKYLKVWYLNEYISYQINIHIHFWFGSLNKTLIFHWFYVFPNIPINFLLGNRALL